METSCHVDGTLFPFDSQSCSIIVQSWAYSEASVDLRNASNMVHLENFNDDGTYDLFHNSCSENHCLRHIHTVNEKPGAMKLRTRGHDITLPFVKYNFNKKNFIARALYNYIQNVFWFFIRFHNVLNVSMFYFL